MGLVTLAAAVACVQGSANGRPSIVTPPATLAASPPPRERMPRPLPEPDLRSRFAPQLDVQITISRNGRLEAVTAPGASCTATLVFSVAPAEVPDGLKAVRIADRGGLVVWTYDAVPSAGGGLQTVTCTRGTQQASATARIAGP